MRVRLLISTCWFVIGFAFVACGGRPVANLDVPEQLTLYSLDGRDFEPGKEPMAEEKFHGYPVLGKVEVTDEARRRELIAALQEGLTRSDGTMAKCFWPRHAIRAVRKGQAVDYVICFECYQVAIHEGNSKTVKPTTREPQQVFNKHLKQAGVPLAPGMSGDND